ncbi:hypothetical protein GYMLUDRAFT_450222 [Collybiopsis luxurians FD-317 M1]|uniref:Uncharacterized protein n=1 Tax=Collybiopsis luxurians FD-317 M1 TaxID=944289 RepID=A0A0D0BI58_9AGAR|nr:hypothetical protein GYMLUDRAFT_450222 [Collybiopsis luxurians FD-317 M1]
MATVLEPYDTPMLDYHPDTDVQMQTNSDPWFHEEDTMEEETNILSRSSSHSDLVDVEIEMDNYLEENTQDSNPEYDMLDEAIEHEPEDVVVMDASLQSHTQELGSFEVLDQLEQAEMLSEPHIAPAIQADLSFSSSLPVDPEIAIEAEPSEIGSTVPVDGASESAPVVTTTATLSEPTLHSEPLPADVPVDESSSLVEPPAPSAGVEAQSTASRLDDDSAGPATHEEHPYSEELAQTEILHHASGIDNQFESTESAEVDRVEGSVESAENETDVQEDVHPVEGSGETAVTEAQEEHGVSRNDPHEISEGVYIDPPPAVLLSFASLEHPDICLFNQMSHSDPSSSTTDPSSYAVLLSDRPTLYYEPLSTVFDALRSDSGFSGVADFSHVELVFDAYDLQLIVSEDNIFARETSLHDLNVLHDGSDFSGPLRLRLQLNTPRFIVRYRMLQDQVLRLNLTDAGEEDTVEGLNNTLTSETTDQEHGPDYTEEVEEEYTQEQEQEQEQNLTETPLQNEEFTGHELDDTRTQVNNGANREDAISGVPLASADLVTDSAINEDAEATGSYDDHSQELEETDAQDEAETYREDAVRVSADQVYEVADDAPEHNGSVEDYEEGSIAPHTLSSNFYLDCAGDDTVSTSNKDAQDREENYELGETYIFYAQRSALTLSL